MRLDIACVYKIRRGRISKKKYNMSKRKIIKCTHMCRNLFNNKSSMFGLDPRRQRDRLKNLMYLCVNANWNRSHVLVVKKLLYFFFKTSRS